MKFGHVSSWKRGNKDLIKQLPLAQVPWNSVISSANGAAQTRHPCYFYSSAIRLALDLDELSSRQEESLLQLGEGSSHTSSRNIIMLRSSWVRTWNACGAFAETSKSFPILGRLVFDTGLTGGYSTLPGFYVRQLVTHWAVFNPWNLVPLSNNPWAVSVGNSGESLGCSKCCQPKTGLKDAWLSRQWCWFAIICILRLLR